MNGVVQADGMFRLESNRYKMMQTKIVPYSYNIKILKAFLGLVIIISSASSFLSFISLIIFKSDVSGLVFGFSVLIFGLVMEAGRQINRRFQAVGPTFIEFS